MLSICAALLDGLKMPASAVINGEIKCLVERVNVTAHLCQTGVWKVKGMYQATVLVSDICPENYEALSGFPRLREVSFSGLWLCHHRAQSCNRQSPLPRFGTGALARVASRLGVVFLSRCGLCDDCVEEMQLEQLRGVYQLSLATNKLLEFPTVLVECFPQMVDLDMSGNTDLCLHKTEARLRQLEGHLPVMQQLRVIH